MNEDEINFIQNQIGYQFKNRELLKQAFTRRSYSMENGGENNEVLEFFGDKVLDIVVVKLLAEEYGHLSGEPRNTQSWCNVEYMGTYVSSLDEGKLTNIKAQLGQKSSLSAAIDNLGLAVFLIMGKGDEENSVRDTPSVKEDLFEAILGAIALDSNWNLTELQDCVSLMLNTAEIMQSGGINYVDEIQKWSLRRTKSIPLHCIEPCSMQTQWYVPGHPLCIYGETASDTHFMCELQMQGVDYHFVGYGKSKSAARRDASRLAYKYLEEQGLLLGIRDEIETPNLEDAISQLEILARRGYFPIPEYGFAETHDKDGNPIWKCECHISGKTKGTSSKDSSKKNAKKQAAYKMLCYVLKEG